MVREVFARAAVCLLTIVACGGSGSAQTAIPLTSEIHLPVGNSRGKFAPFPREMYARAHFAMRVAPDQSVLIFDSDASGRWPLVRVRKWWTPSPDSEVLELPGWSNAETKNIYDIRVDVQVTPDGRYAVAFGEAIWYRRSTFLLHVPRGYVERPPDTMITVVDLEKWKVLKTTHTSTLRDLEVDSARVLSDAWLLLDGPRTAGSDAKHGLHPFFYELLSVPDLQPGAGCAVRRFSHLWQPAPEELVASVSAENGTACGAVLDLVGVSNVDAMEERLRQDSNLEPVALKLQDVSWHEDYFEQESHEVRSKTQRLWDAEEMADRFFSHWGAYPLYGLYWQNLPFESSSQLWYGLYPAQERGFYDLERWGVKGQKQATQTEHQLLCGDAALGDTTWCGCRVVDVSEETHALLTYCRKQHGDYDGAVQRQWLSMFRPDDLSPIGLIDLPKRSETLQTILRSEGKAYVVTLEHGELLRVPLVPARP